MMGFRSSWYDHDEARDTCHVSHLTALFEVWAGFVSRRGFSGHYVGEEKKDAAVSQVTGLFLGFYRDCLREWVLGLVGSWGGKDAAASQVAGLFESPPGWVLLCFFLWGKAPRWCHAFHRSFILRSLALVSSLLHKCVFEYLNNLTAYITYS